MSVEKEAKDSLQGDYFSIHFHYLSPGFTQRSSRKSGLTVGQDRIVRDSQTRGVFKGSSFRLALEVFQARVENYLIGATTEVVLVNCQLVVGRMKANRG
jgi:hypothetical protein